jgi:lipoprotein-anchoring transpeptidase ErfK/SrfK
MSRAVLWVVAILIALGVAWWVVQSIGPTDSEAIAVAKAEAQRNAELAASMQAERDAARAEANRVDTLIRTVLRNPPPVRPVTPPAPVLDTLGRDSLRVLVNVLEAYSDTVTRENVVLRATLDTARQTFARYRVVADSTINVQERQIAALNIVVDVQECRIARVLKCPSRKLAFVGGAVLAAGAVAYVRQR